METKTYAEAVTFLNVANEILNQSNGKEPVTLTKFIYALQKVQKKVQKQVEKGFTEPIDDLRVGLALTADKDTDKMKIGELLRDDRGQFRFTRENHLSLTKKHRELLAANVEVESHYADNPPAHISPAQRFALMGFVIKDEEPAEA